MRYNEYMSDVKPWDMLNPNEKRSEEELVEYRLSICAECPFFRKGAQQCRKCGCFMKLKTRLHRANCPMGKW